MPAQRLYVMFQPTQAVQNDQVASNTALTLERIMRLDNAREDVERRESDTRTIEATQPP